MSFIHYPVMTNDYTIDHILFNSFNAMVKVMQSFTFSVLRKDVAWGHRPSPNSFSQWDIVICCLNWTSTKVFNDDFVCICFAMCICCLCSKLPFHTYAQIVCMCVSLTGEEFLSVTVLFHCWCLSFLVQGYSWKGVDP